MKHLMFKPAAFLALACVLVSASCANFRKLGKDLKLVNDEYRVTGVVRNADDHQCPVRAVVIEWDQKSKRIFSADLVELTDGGAFMFIVKSPLNQHVVAYADVNRDQKYNAG